MVDIVSDTHIILLPVVEVVGEEEEEEGGTVARLVLAPMSGKEKLALCMGTTWAWLTVGVDSEGGWRLKGATMAWGTFLMAHSWLPKPGLLQ